MRWRGLAWIPWRQHRTSAGGIVVLFLLIAALMALVRAPVHNAIRPHDQFRELVFLAVVLLLQLAPVLAGIFAGAPLIAREAENGTLKLAWTQGAARDRWLLAGVVPVTGLLALTAAALGVELRWWLAPAGWAAGNSWLPQLFSLNPLPSAGWVTLGFTLGVCLGALIRRTVPAMAATFAGYAALWLATAASSRASYLTPLHPPHTPAQIGPGGSYGHRRTFPAARRPGPNIPNTALRWPAGRPARGGYPVGGRGATRCARARGVSSPPKSRRNSRRFARPGSRSTMRMRTSISICIR